MRIINSTGSALTFTDFDRGNAGESKGIYEFWNAKADNGVPAFGFIDILDTEEVMLSAEMGQIKKFKTAGWIDTLHSIVGTKVEAFTIVTGVNDVFEFELEGEGLQSVTLPAGDLTAADVISSISGSVSASGFAAEVVAMYRASNQDNVVPGMIDGPLGKAYGQRTSGILDGFIGLIFDGIITIGSGTANATLGFNAGDFTKVG